MKTTDHGKKFKEGRYLSGNDFMKEYFMLKENVKHQLKGNKDQ